jgi:predicted SprT family Zn-dependent metalloprotease
MHQTSFPFELDECSLRTYLQKSSRRNISLVITDNTSSMLSMRPAGNTIALRLHKMFLSACNDVLDELVRYINDSRRKTPLIRKFINDNLHSLRDKPARKITARTMGCHFDLRDIYEKINREYFDSSVTASISWGAKGPRRAARNRTLGSYSSYGNIIRINPILDSKRVPRYFMEFIVYHEMLHAHMGIEKVAGRRSVHSREFKSREKAFKEYERAVAWEKKRW